MGLFWNFFSSLLIKYCKLIGIWVVSKTPFYRSATELLVWASSIQSTHYTSFVYTEV
jgi:hypothetical protein